MRKNETSEGSLRYVRSEYPEKEDKQIIVNKMKLIDGKELTGIDVFSLVRGGYYFYFTIDGRSQEGIERYIKDYKETILPALRYRSNDEIPKEPGFCFENGFIANEHPEGGAERAILLFTLKDYPDVRITISSEVYFAPETPLIEGYRERIPKPLDGEDSVKKREVNGMEGDELLLSETMDGLTKYYYQWDSLGEVKNPLKPGISLEIETSMSVDGEPPVSTALTKEQVRALYETILKSIRLRPTETKPADAPQSRLPLGTRVASWQPCPQTGLWECDPPQVEGARRRLFQSGQRLPPVMVPVARSLWQRLRGQPAARAIDTVWTLVEDAPDV
jgi:hypothetical protein